MGNSSIFEWVKRLVHERAKRAGRHKWKEGNYLDYDVADQLSSEKPQSEIKWIQERNAIVWKCVKRLDHNHRLIVINEMESNKRTQEELAKSVNKTVRTIGRWWAQALKLLSNCLEEHGVCKI